MNSKIAPGYLYVLVHQDLPNYYKLGQTTKHPVERLKTHNNDNTRLLGRVAVLTNKPWQLIYFVPVTDPRRAESATLWYDVLPRWDNLEINKGDVICAIEDIIKSPYLDKERYSYLLKDELLHFDYKKTLVELQQGWALYGLHEKCEELISKVKEERNKKDKRRKYFY